MAVATATFTENAFPKGVDNTQRHGIRFGTLAIGASPLTYATGGIAITFPAFVDTLVGWTPVWMDVTGLAGYQYIFVPSTNKLQIQTINTGTGIGAEIAASAIPAAVSGDTIVARVEFMRNI